MVCWSRVEVKNGLGHISAVENLEKWKKREIFNSQLFPFPSHGDSIFFSCFLSIECTFIIQCGRLIGALFKGCHKRNRHLFKVKCRYFDTASCHLLLHRFYNSIKRPTGLLHNAPKSRVQKGVPNNEEKLISLLPDSPPYWGTLYSSTKWW